MDLGLKGRTVLVMGGSRGIGLACARGFLSEGATIALCARSPASVEAALRELPGATGICADVSDPVQVTRMIDEAIVGLGRIDVLVVNAGGPPPGAIEALDDEDWAAAVDLTLMSSVRAARGVLPGMRQRRWGRIVVISSFGVKQPIAGLSLSNSVRMAVLGWAKTLSLQVAVDNITVNTVCPGWTLTDRVTSLLDGAEDAEAMRRSILKSIPMGRIGEPEEIARLAVFLGSDAASYITGTAIAVDGGVVQGYA